VAGSEPASPPADQRDKVLAAADINRLVGDGSGRKATRAFDPAETGRCPELIVGDSCDATLVIRMMSDRRQEH